MPGPLLKTKLCIPPAQPDIIPRPRLVEQLNAGLSCKLTLVSAPAGFGKTTLVRAWAEQVERPVAWLSLDREDNVPARFLAYLIAAVASIGVEQGIDPENMLQLPDISSVETILSTLINDIAAASMKFILVLDDFHLTDVPAIHQALGFLLAHRPPQLHLVIVTRSDPNFPLARMRAQGQINEVRAAALRFTVQESQAFMYQVLGANISAEYLAALNVRTEGWIVGLKMAAVSMRERADVDGFIHSFTGSNRFIFDFLIEEVLQGRSEQLQEFMLHTCILHRMNAELCSVLTGIENCQPLLEQLVAQNMFIVLLDDQGRWFRYHHLFADLLKQRLHYIHPDKLPTLHQNAGRWFREQGLLADAVRHALAADDFDSIVGLIKEQLFDAVERQELTTLVSWLERLPVEQVRSRPWLSLAYAWALEEIVQLDQVQTYLDRAELALAGGRDILAAEARKIKSYIYLLRAKMGLRDRDFVRTCTFAQKAQELIPETETRLRGVVASLRGSALWSQGDLDAAAKTFKEGIAASLAAGDLNNAIKVYGDLMGLYVQRGQLCQAEAAGQQALTIIQQYRLEGGRIPRAASYIHFRLSQVLRQWNDLDGSLRHAQASQSVNRSWGLEIRATWINLASAYQLGGDLNQAEQALRRAEEIASRGSEHWQRDVASARAMLALARGDLQRALAWANGSGLGMTDEINQENLQMYLALARIKTVQVVHQNQADHSDLEMMLSKLEVLVNQSGALTYVITLHILQSLVLEVRGDTEAAVNRMAAALRLGESGGFIRPFLQGGDVGLKLIQMAAGQVNAPAYIGRIMAAFGIELPAPAQISQQPSGQVEELTPREKQVLLLLNSPLTATEIAAELSISATTVRTHIKRIYSKLDVHSRLEAIHRAETLGLM